MTREQTYFTYGGLGSATGLTDEAGDVLDAYTYDAFGAVRTQRGSSQNAFTFTGEQVDGATGLQYLRARYYDPAIGRFLSQDPLPGGLALSRQYRRGVPEAERYHVPGAPAALLQYTRDRAPSLPPASTALTK